MIAKRQSGFSPVEIVIGVIVLIIIGFLVWAFVSSLQSNSQKDNTTQSAQTSEIDPAALTDLADIATIQQSALEGKEGASVNGIQLKTEDGKLVYQASLSDGSVLTFDAKSGTKLSEEKETADDTAKSLPAGFNGGIGLARAIEVAKITAPNSAVRELELEQEDGVLVYRVKFANEAQIDVNATTGTIIRTKAAKKESATKSKPSTKGNDTKKEDSSSPETEVEHKSSTERRKSSDDSTKSESDSSKDDNDMSGKDSNDDTEDHSGSDHEDQDNSH